MTREQRRSVILDAAESLFAEQGYALTRLEDVAGAADVSKQLLQRHFASKRDLMLAVLERHRDGLIGRLSTASPMTTLDERLRQRTDAWFGYLEDHPGAANLLFFDITGDPEVVSFYTEARAVARAAVADMLRAEKGLVIPEALLVPVAEMIRAGTVGLAVWWSTNQETPRERIVQLALEVWTGSLWCHTALQHTPDKQT